VPKHRRAKLQLSCSYQCIDCTAFNMFYRPLPCWRVVHLCTCALLRVSDAVDAAAPRRFFHDRTPEHWIRIRRSQVTSNLVDIILVNMFLTRHLWCMYPAFGRNGQANRNRSTCPSLRPTLKPMSSGSGEAALETLRAWLLRQFAGLRRQLIMLLPLSFAVLVSPVHARAMMAMTYAAAHPRNLSSQ